ncbi:MAG: potassium channel protein [Thermodesulfobacteriota bacterium]|nr:potassium channel protein [Thermodesulfobacteriota bacterium]
MDKIKHLITAIATSAIIFAAGTVGYMTIEKWNILDSAYMTAITLSGVGYGEVHTTSPQGKCFSILLIFAGLGFFVYLAGTIMQFVVEGEIKALLGRRRLDKRIAKLNDHYIVCGYGRIGRTLCKLLKEETSDVVVLEKSEKMIPLLDSDKMLHLQGDAADEVLLIKAGIERASYLIAALATDTDNVFLVLTARQLSPDIYIMARAGTKGVTSKLIAAGANRVESPYDIGAVSMGLRLLRPSVSNFLEIALARKKKAIQIEEAVISSKSQLVNIMLKDSGIRQQYNLIIISINKADGQMIFNPSFDTYLEEGDIVIAMGRAQDLKNFAKALNPE